jgi:lipoprotein LpqH
VESLGMVVDGSALAVSNTGGVKSGSADVKVDGGTYTITGEAAGADIKNPMAGMITKPFTVTVTCK